MDRDLIAFLANIFKEGMDNGKLDKVMGNLNQSEDINKIDRDIGWFYGTIIELYGILAGTRN